MRGKGAGFDCFPYGAVFSAASRAEGHTHGAARGDACCDYMNLALSEVGGFSDALQRGALPHF
jgi:hypothetical protein